MEYHGEPVGGVPEGGQQNRGGHGGPGRVEPEHHADHAEADGGKGADHLRGQWAHAGLCAVSGAGGCREEGDGQFPEKGLQRQRQHAGEQLHQETEAVCRGAFGASADFG